MDEIAKLPGVRIVDSADVTPGPTPDTYAFSRENTQRNLYRGSSSLDVLPEAVSAARTAQPLDASRLTSSDHACTTMIRSEVTES
jgi:hypothetical protein